MGRAAMCGMIGALSITIGTIVIPSENFVQLKAKEASGGVVPAVSMEYKAPNVEESQVNATTNTCQHTDGNHTSDCPYWTGGQDDSGNSSAGAGNSAGNGNGAGYGGRHGGGHHGNHHGW